MGIVAAERSRRSYSWPEHRQEAGLILTPESLKEDGVHELGSRLLLEGSLADWY